MKVCCIRGRRTVMAVEDFYDDEYLDEDAIKLLSFYQFLNVHVNVARMRGQIKYQRYTCGGLRASLQKSSFFRE
jgi:phosphatidylserine decarboxylase